MIVMLILVPNCSGFLPCDELVLDFRSAPKKMQVGKTHHKKWDVRIDPIKLPTGQVAVNNDNDSSQKRNSNAESKAKKNKGPRGKKPEKSQISVRIDKTLLNLAYTLADRKGQRITDVLERGVLLAVEEGLGESLVTEQARFVLGKATPEEQRLVTLFLVYWRFSPKLTVFVDPNALVLQNLEATFRDYLKKRLQVVGSAPNFPEMLQAFNAGEDAPGSAEA